MPAPPPLEGALPAGAVARFEDGALGLVLSTDIYSLAAILRSSYWLTDRCYVHLNAAGERSLEVTLLAKSGKGTETRNIAWEFLNNLIDSQLRISIQQETAAVREMIVSQAFSDVDVIDDRGRRVDAGSLPKVDQDAITTWRPAP